MMGNHIENLEQRRLMASDPVILLDGGVLRIGGTDVSDDIAIEAGKTQFKVHANGQVQAFNTADVRLIRISGGRGHDSIIVSPNLRIRANIEGGPGNDRIGGSAREDTIFGQAGNDTLVGNGGVDYIDAGSGDDLLDGNRQLSEQFPANEIDVLHGGSGFDTAGINQRTYGSGVEKLLGIFFGETARLRSDFRRINGRMIGSFDELIFWPAETAFIRPRLADDGRYVVRFREITEGSGVNEVNVGEDFDVTAALRTGLMYERYDIGATTPTARFVILLPSA